MNIFITSDTHNSHSAIIKYCNRPFLSFKDNQYFESIGRDWKNDKNRYRIDNQSLQMMDDALFYNTNSLVQKHDELYHLGDVLFGPKDDYGYIKMLKEWRSKINCDNVHLIFGNHDRKRLRHEYTKLFASVHDMDEIRVGSQRIVLCHYALRVWEGSHRGNWQLYGHSHNTLPDDPNALSIDVGVDAYAGRHGNTIIENYRPFSFDEVDNIMSKKTYKSVDHHGDN